MLTTYTNLPLGVTCNSRGPAPPGFSRNGAPATGVTFPLPGLTDQAITPLSSPPVIPASSLAKRNLPSAVPERRKTDLAGAALSGEPATGCKPPLLLI